MAQSQFIGEDEFKFSDDKNETLICVDYDDTIYPHSYFVSLGLGDANTPIPQAIKDQLKIYSETVGTFLTRITDLGQVVFITNSMNDWIPFSATRCFSPEVCGIIAAIPQISASDKYRHLCPENTAENQTNWKYFAMKEQLELRPRTKKFFSIGDSQFERQAALRIKNERSDVVYFLTKFNEYPNLEVLNAQLKLVISMVYHISKVKNGVDFITTVKIVPDEAPPRSPPPVQQKIAVSA